MITAYCSSAITILIPEAEITGLQDKVDMYIIACCLTMTHHVFDCRNREKVPGDLAEHMLAVIATRYGKDSS